MILPPGKPGDDQPKLELSYPCPWTYTVIGTDEATVRAAVAGVLEPIEHDLVFSHASRTGKYLSFTVEIVVHTERERLRIYRELHEHPDIRYTI